MKIMVYILIYQIDYGLRNNFDNNWNKYQKKSNIFILGDYLPKIMRNINFTII